MSNDCGEETGNPQERTTGWATMLEVVLVSERFAKNYIFSLRTPGAYLLKQLA